MPSPTDTGPGAASRRKKKACRRCRHRKQRCDFEQPCHNCEAAGVECMPVIPDSMQSYPAGYVPALENHAAILEQTLNERFPGTALDHLDNVRTQYLGTPLPVMQDFEGQQPSGFDGLMGTSPESERMWQWQPPQTPTQLPSSMNAPMQIGSIGMHQASPPGFAPQATATAPRLIQNVSMTSHGVGPRSEGMDDIPTATAASFFRIYFQFIHPQYPFLSIRECGNWYTEWKTAPPHRPVTGWPAFFVKMIFAIGSLIQSKSDTAPRYQHQDLKSQAQSEDAIIRSTHSSPLIRLQAMLLSAMHALHSESTARISHISGAIIRFASLQGFHRLANLDDEESQMKIKAWSCAYILDRAVSMALDIPSSLADIYISTTLYTERVEPPCQSHMPWLDDVPPSEIPDVLPTLTTFTHTCKIRLIQSYCLHTMHAVPTEGGATPEWQDSMLVQIDNWATEIYSHSLIATEGYQSPLWLRLIEQLSRLALCRPSRLNINSKISDVALKAGCNACTTFRALQKKRQVAQPWLIVITQFQAGVTILYIIWARAIQIPPEADFAIRDCTSVLAILADRWQNAEVYRDCFEVLARAIPRCKRLGCLEREAREELVGLIERVNEVGVHRHVLTMLYEMGMGPEDEDMI
ncbi:hypothetical protein DL98DRAFT_570350 [Cadophora sp. DSE1049]|nr:hypothetical protein DL98DRAFT_570350 [Cadophora sp. DSE1049]